MVAGKDVVSNEVLIKKHTDPYDVVFHVDIVGSPFAVIKTEGKEPEKPHYSRQPNSQPTTPSMARRHGRHGRLLVKPEQLRQSGPSGEFVPRGAFMVNGKRSCCVVRLCVSRWA